MLRTVRSCTIACVIALVGIGTAHAAAAPGRIIAFGDSFPDPGDYDHWNAIHPTEAGHAVIPTAAPDPIRSLSRRMDCP